MSRKILELTLGFVVAVMISIIGVSSVAQAAPNESREQNVMQTRIATEEQRIEVCEAKNARLAAIAYELMARYEKKGVADVLAGREPLFGLKTVETENLLEEYRDRIGTEKVELSTKGKPHGRP